jgi:hypothetical protein
VNHRDIFGQQILYPILEDSVRVAAADFHDFERARGQMSNLLGQFSRDVALPVFVYKLHKTSKRVRHAESNFTSRKQIPAFDS